MARRKTKKRRGHGLLKLIIVLAVLVAAGGYYTLGLQPVAPDSGEPVQDAYGPTLLACLEYTAHRYGIHPHLGQVWFSLGRGKAYEYDAAFYGHRYAIRSDGRQAEIRIDGKTIGRWDCGIRVMTGETGGILGTVQIETMRGTGETGEA